MMEVTIDELKGQPKGENYGLGDYFVQGNDVYREVVHYGKGE